MSSKAKANRIFEKWKVYLINADRGYDAISGNFDELFYDLAKADIKADTAKVFLGLATKEHLPAPAMAKWTYKRMDKNIVGTYEEFMANWTKNITDKATASYYAMFPFDSEEPEEEKKYGSMSKQEYMKQRRYASQFPELDINSIPDHKELDEVSFDWNEVEGGE